MANVWRKESVSWRAEKKGKIPEKETMRERKREREREREKERITVISVDNAMSKHNDVTFAR